MCKKNKTAVIIIIGNEILSGRTQDQNTSYIAKRLAELGIVLAEVIIIPDVAQTIIDKVQHYADHYDYVFTTGGIGPTHDDITTASIARAFNVELIRHPEAVSLMQQHYSPEALTPARLKMADIPVGATLIENPVSSAPAYQLNNVFVLAGVPSIMQAMFDSLADRLVTGEPILTASVCTNLTESKLAEGMAGIQNECEAVSIGSYPYFKQGQVGVNIVLRSTNETLLLKQHACIIALIKKMNGTTFDVLPPT